MHVALDKRQITLGQNLLVNQYRFTLFKRIDTMRYYSNNYPHS